MILYSVGEVIIFEHGCYISALEYVRMLILSSYVLPACIKKFISMVTHGRFCLGDLVRLSFYFGSIFEV